jgi:GTP cyclohydrolase II
VSGAEPIAFIVGDVGGRDEAVVVRVHDQCVTSEVFGSLKCDCKQQLDAALARVQASPPGMLIYLPQEGRGIGLANKIAAYDLQTRCGLDTVDANRALGLPDDAREYGAAASILRDVQVRRVALLTNNPRKVEHLRRLGVEVSRRVPHFVAPAALPAQANAYVRAKVARMGHVISGIVEQV